MSRSALAARYADEGLRMDEHPGIVFRDGPMGRRAVVIGGPDCWEIFRAVRAVRDADDTLTEAHLGDILAADYGVSGRVWHVALTYWAGYPDEVNMMVDYAQRSEVDLAAAAERAHVLLTR